ncbi:MAG: cell surface protein SprA [Ignavibacteriales bacterium]|nr:cell surface protein SprA [Ignavibacteriales bacterium]
MVPFFIIAVSVFFGFRDTDNLISKPLLFDDFINHFSPIYNSSSLPGNSITDNQDNFDFRGSSFGIPDSTGKLKISPDSTLKSKVITDSTQNLKTVAMPDSTKKLNNSPDSTLKTKLNSSVDSTKNLIKPALPDSTRLKTIKANDSIPKGDTKLNTAKILEKDSVKAKISIADSIRAKTKLDSLNRIILMSKDSTARLKYFHYHRDDYPYLPFREKKPSSFFVQPSQGTITRISTLDSAATKVTIKEMMGGKSIRPQLQMPLDVYTKLRLDAITRELWEAKAHEYKLVDKKKDLTQFITDITNIDIPLPSTPLLSIFGPPKINLKINGQVDIHGAWRNETTTGITTSALGNTRNEPDFKQTVAINLAGTIGDKLTLGADWNTERQFQYENQLKLKYTGYEDEIIQSIEAGNVSLQTSPLVGGSEALFGVKAQFKIGPFSLTALASQKKSEIQEVSVSGGAKAQTFEIHAYDYSPNHFFINTIYTDPKLNIFNNYFGNAIPRVVDSLRVKDIQVWKTITGLANPNERKGNAFIDLPRRIPGQKTYASTYRDSTVESVPGIKEIDRRFILLQPDVDYVLHAETGFITFKTQIQDQDAIAVAFRLEGPTTAADDDIYYGEFINDLQSANVNRLVLQLVKPPNLQPQFRQAWQLQLKNIYPVGGRDVKEEGFKLDMNYRVEGQELQNNYNGIKLLETFGLDKTDKSGTSTQPDGAFDFFPTRTIFPSTGEVVFPVLQPFGKDFPAILPDSLKYQSIYDTLITFAKQDRSKDKFVMAGEYSASVSSSYNIGFNVVENSVKVLLNGSAEKEGIDYTVDYNLGQILIRDDKALVPGADLKITYEQNDLFQLASKTLLGFRGLYEFNRETTLGFSILNLNQQTLSDKVRIGEEPMNNSIYGADFKTNINLPFITKALDNVISTSAPSNLTLNAEYAYINPDPNTKKSTIASDGGRSIAYVDDFEGAKRIIPLGMGYGQWHDLSVPLKLPLIGDLEKSVQMNYKAKTYWYNRTPSDVTIKDIYGNRKTAAPDASLITALDLVFDPSIKGTYNWDSHITEDKNKNWGGFMRTLSSTANNLVEENIEFIEFWLKTNEAPNNLKINIDLGQVSEDVIPNNKLDTEDKNSNDLVDQGEDIGIDGLKDVDEPGYDAATNPDPSGDDYSFQLTQNPDYSHVNGNEGNAVAIDQGRLPDSEDLNRNFTLDRTDSYYRYEIPIDTSRIANKFVQGGNAASGWYLYRIPLKDFVATFGSPSFSVVEFIRVWVSGSTSPVHLRFAEMNLVGNQWQKVLVPNKVTTADTVLTVSTINIEDNPEYVSPPGVFREKDRTQPNYDIYKNEQALNLILTNLQDGDSREVVRYLYKPLDVFNYKEMKLFIHSDKNEMPGSVSYYDSTKPNNYGSEVYLRFGSDSTNYYEYRQPVRYNSDPANNGWDEVSMVFSELTAIKQKRDSLASKNLYTVDVPGKKGHTYGVRGEPTLTRISFFTIGIINPRDKGTPNATVSGSVWINELRVLDADATKGGAYSANASLKFADLLNVSGNISRTDPYFHSLVDRFGSREDHTQWGIAADLDVLKLLPVNLPGSNLRVSYSRTELKNNPLYTPGTDIKISEAQTQLRNLLTEKNVDPVEIDRQVAALVEDARTQSVSESWNLANIKIKIPTELWYIRDTFNNLSFSFNYNKSTGSSPTVVQNENWVWNASASYAVNLSRDLYFKPVDIPILGSLFGLFSDYRDMKIYFLPQSITSQVTANRKWSFSQSRNLKTVTAPNILRDFTATRGAGFNWAMTEGGFLNLSLNYNFDVSSTLAYLLTTGTDIERSESEIWRDIFGGNLFGKDFNYKQSLDLKSNPKLPSIWDLNRFITLSAGYSANYAWQNNFTQKDLGRSAGYTNRIALGFTVRVKSIFAPLFKEESSIPASLPAAESGKIGGRGRPRSSTQQNVQAHVDESKPITKDSTNIKTDSTDIVKQDSVTGPNSIQKSLEFLKLGVKWLLLDYDNVSVNFSQSSSYTGGGIAGEGTGFNNFWGVAQSNSKGPSRMFMLGLSNDLGTRAPLGNLQDTYTQKNDLSFKTSRPLWEGAQLDLSWSVGWNINKTATIQTDSLGNINITNLLSTGQLDRSFLSLPPTLLFSFLGNGIKKVSELYNPTAANPGQNLSDAFLNGFETFSVLSKIPILGKFAKYIPRPNWSFTWSGLEKYSIFSFAKRVQITHVYTSNYSEGWRINPDGVQETQTQRVDYAFAPLVGISMNFDQFFGGSFQGSVRFSTKSSFSLGVSTQNITEAYSRDINISASYTKSGFELPLFGISLKNDLEISFSYTSGKTSSIIYDMMKFIESGTPQDGKTNTVIEPKIRYVMSQSVSLTIFYRRTTIEPEGASRIPPTTTNEAGVDVRITIAPR